MDAHSRGRTDVLANAGNAASAICLHCAQACALISPHMGLTMQNRIFSLDNPKASKAKAYGWLNAIHYMAPHSLASVGNLCAHASPGCIELCLGQHSGAAIYYPSVIRSRIAKAQRFMRDRKAYLEDMKRAIASACREATRNSLYLCVRPNGSTDIPWESIRDASGLTLPERFPSVQFTDYTKSVKRALAHAAGKLPENYHLTFSRSETNESDCLRVLQAGGNVAAVFASGLPETWHGFAVIDGDAHDLRHLDPRGVVVGLSPKGNRAKRDTSGFVIR